MNISYILTILLLGTVATYFSGNKQASRVALFFSSLAFISSILLFNNYEGLSLDYETHWIEQPTILFALKADGLSIAMLLLTTALSSIIILSSLDNKFEKSKNFYALVIFMTFAMVGTFLSSNGFVYYIFWELSLIPIYFIALLWGNGDEVSRKRAVLKFFIYTFAGSLFMLVAFIYLYQKTHSFQIEDLYNVELSNEEQFWIFLAFFLAYAIKIPIIPFHTWQAKIYQKAPTVGTMLLSGIMLKMGLYSVIRWQLPITPNASRDYLYLFVGLGIAGVIYGSIVALTQKDIKKLLAYSSLAHVGLIVAGTYTLTLDGLRGAVLQMIAHGFVVVGLFFVVEVIYRRWETRKISDMGGIRTQTPKFASMFLILVLASVSLPTTFNFIGEFTLLYSLFQINIFLAFVGGLTIILGAFYMLRMYQHVMLGESFINKDSVDGIKKDLQTFDKKQINSSEKTNVKIFKDITFNEGFVFVLIIIVLLFFGFYPKPIIDLITPSLENILVHINRN